MPKDTLIVILALDPPSGGRCSDDKPYEPAWTTTEAHAKGGMVVEGMHCVSEGGVLYWVSGYRTWVQMVE